MTSRLRTVAALIISVAFLMILPLTLTMNGESVELVPPTAGKLTLPTHSFEPRKRSDEPSGSVDGRGSDFGDGESISGRPPGIVFVTVQTGATPTWCRMLLSGFLSGNVSVVNLAWGHKYAHIKRPRWILDFIDQAKLPNDHILFFGDGGDTLFAGMPPSHIAETFGRLTHSIDTPSEYGRVLAGEMLPALMFNAEANCYHQQTFHGSWGVKKGKCLSAYKRHNPNITTVYRYLNAGAWIGRVWAVRKVFAEVRRIIDKDASLWCDQSVIGGVYLSARFRGVLGLDHFNRIFLPTYHLRPERDLCPPEEHHQGLRQRSSEPNLRMCHSGHVPSFIHFNGKSEGAFTMQVIQRTSWWRAAAAERVEAVSAARRRGVTFLADLDHPVSIGTVCPHLGFP
jgi:hypothetical protein